MQHDASALSTPGTGRGLIDVFSQRYLLRLIVRKELRVRYRGSMLGMAWSYVKPAIQFLVYFVALGLFMRLAHSIEAYPIYLFSGIVVINFFNEGFGNATRSIIWNAPLVRKIYLPRELFPVASMWVSAVHFLPQLVVLLVATLIAGWRPGPVELLAGVVGFTIVALFSLGLGLLFGAVNVFYRDAENFVDLIGMVATWASPVLYQWEMVRDVVPGWLFTVYQLNPLTAAVELFHYCFWFPATAGAAGTPPVVMPPNLWFFAGIALLVSFGTVLIGQTVFRRLEGRFAQEL